MLEKRETSEDGRFLKKKTTEFLLSHRLLEKQAISQGI